MQWALMSSFILTNTEQQQLKDDLNSAAMPLSNLKVIRTKVCKLIFSVDGSTEMELIHAAIINVLLNLWFNI